MNNILKDSINQILQNGDIIWYPIFKKKSRQFNMAVINDENFYSKIRDYEHPSLIVYALPLTVQLNEQHKHVLLIKTQFRSFFRCVKICQSQLKWESIYKELLNVSIHINKNFKY